MNLKILKKKIIKPKWFERLELRDFYWTYDRILKILTIEVHILSDNVSFLKIRNFYTCCGFNVDFLSINAIEPHILKFKLTKFDAEVKNFDEEDILNLFWFY